MTSLRIALLSLGLASALPAASYDVEGMGRDFNGWNKGKAGYVAAGWTFEVEEPELSSDPGGNLTVRASLHQLLPRGTRPYVAELRALASPGGVIYSVRISGTLNGRSFETGEVTRPSAPEPLEPAEGEEAAPGVPFDPDQQMVDELVSRLQSALARSLASKQKVKYDLSAWLAGGRVEDNNGLAEGTRPVVRSVFRRTGR